LTSELQKDLSSTDEIIDWQSLYNKSDEFKNNKPFKFTFVKGIFKQDFFDKLYETFPKFDDTWFHNTDYRRSAHTKPFYKEGDELKSDPNLSTEWNKLKFYINSSEFVENLSKFYGKKVTTMELSGLFANKKADFQLPHIDVDGEYTNNLQLLFYFSKGWQKGDPGGTYVCETDDESSILFEPYDLDNSVVIFEETPHSWHGTRYITKDVVRQALAVALR
jgi:hypothetical protein